MKIVTAYSGGLDTSVMIPWLSENNGAAEIIAYTGDLGQGEDLPAIKAKALNTGAKKAFVEDLQQRFVDDFIWPALKPGALYEGTYPLHTALGRPLLAQRLAEVAIAEGADAIAHGCTAKGNDQVRFEVTIRALAPQLKIMAPLREWELVTREMEVAYALERKIPIPVTAAKPYSIDRNLWGCAIECGEMENLWAEPPADAWQMTQDPTGAPSGSEELTIGFEAGIPVSLNGTPMNGVALIKELSDLACRYGIGRIDMVENRVVGLKSREVYEAPAATLLHLAHTELERICLDRATSNYKRRMSQDFANIIYEGLWFTPLRECLASFIDQSQAHVTGDVRLRISAGLAQVTGRRSPFSLYDEGLATYSHGDTFDRTMATGFMEIYGLSAKTVAMVRRRNGLPTAAREQVGI
ncbi:MAG: argininosuccinate synthase [Candidatus Sericytochromatia bacterium]|nr:argininosuccinate synthase [Candidatus Sericytochromatia bacterium]